MAVDLDSEFNAIANRVKALKAYKDLKRQYDEAVKTAGDSFEPKNSSVSQKLSSLKDKKEAVQKKVKNQFQKLLDLSRITGGKYTNTIAYLKRAFIKTIEKIKPEIDKILIGEIINALGCDQQQTYYPQTIYVKVSSVDLKGALKDSPETDIGKLFYEKLPVVIQSRPFSMNRELYGRIQSTSSYSGDTGQLYLGASGQPLFDIKYVDINPITNQGGGWFEVTLVNRVNNLNVVYQFLTDYFKTINIFDFKDIMASVMDLLTGAISMEGSYGVDQLFDSAKLSLLIQRVLGLCFDSVNEIDVSGKAKVDGLSETDSVSFFELSEIDLRDIDSKIANIQEGVVVFEDCDNVKLPVNSQDIIGSLLNLITLEDNNDQVEAADNLTNVVTGNPLWGINLNIPYKLAVDLDFLNLICEAIIRSLLSPKIVLPFMVMYKAVHNNIQGIVVDTINSYFFFFQEFKKFMINIVSKIGAIFVRELVDIIKKDLLALIQTIVSDITKEKTKSVMTIILKLTQFLLIGLRFVDDWRKCKSVLDEILQAINLAISSFGLKVPAPLLSFAQFLDGYSETRAFIGTIEEMQKMGIPTGTLPDGSPNLDLLAKYALLKAQNAEQVENGYIASFADTTYTTPTGMVIRNTSYGKGF